MIHMKNFQPTPCKKPQIIYLDKIPTNYFSSKLSKEFLISFDLVIFKHSRRAGDIYNIHLLIMMEMNGLLKIHTMEIENTFLNC